MDPYKLVPARYNKEFKVRQWLNSKTNDDYVETKYSPNYDNALQPIYAGTHDNEKFFDYYKVDDQDVLHSDKFYAGLLRNIRETDPERFKEDEQLDYLDCYLESYINHPESIKNNVPQLKEYIDILIPPNSNRYHTNLLFKNMIECTLTNGLFYKSIDNAEHQLVDTDLKDAFYDFCYHHTSKYT